MALTHEFAWSASRAVGFRECKRAHYYRYYGGWGGWSAGAPEERRAIYRLNKMTRMVMLSGNAVHICLARYFRMKPGHVADAKEISEQAIEMLRSGYKESAGGLWKQRPAKFTHLAEHHFEENCVSDRDAVAAYGGSFVERIEQCVYNFFESSDLAWTREADPSLYQFVEDDQSAFDSFEYKGTKIYGSPDFAIRDLEGRVHLYDWKTGNPSKNDAFQLHVYALYARIEWDVAVENFSGYDAYLRTGEVTRCEITPQSMEAAEEEIEASIDAMRSLHFDADQGMGDKEAFPMIGAGEAGGADMKVCARCNFRELCGR